MPDLVAIFTLVVSTIDVVGTMALACMSGKCSIDCCGSHWEHTEPPKVLKFSESAKQVLQNKINPEN